MVCNRLTMCVFRLVPAALIAVLLAGCSQQSDTRQLREQLAEIAARPAGAVEPLPTFEPYEAFTYSAASMRSPFDPPQLLVAADREQGPDMVQPDFNRRSEPLEAFSLNTLEMVGTFSRGSRVLALIRDEAGHVHRVGRGNYVGRNHGRVVAVAGDRVDLIEIVPSGDGGWIERPRTLGMSQ